jgi:acetylxylan esterase
MRLLQYLSLGVTALSSFASGQLQQVTNFGSNPSGVRMYIFVPPNVQANPAIIVALHYCTGTAQAYYSGTQYANLAKQHGFIVIYPESPYSGTCWDVSSTKTLTHEGGGDTQGIASMVAYTIDKYQANPDKVFVTGSSSGAMMTVRAAPKRILLASTSSFTGGI